MKSDFDQFASSNRGKKNPTKVGFFMVPVVGFELTT